MPRPAPVHVPTPGTQSDQRLAVVTVRQPWATLIAQGVKNVENRSWATNWRGLVAVHASLIRIDREAVDDFGFRCDDLPRGAIVGVVDLHDCVDDADSAWAEPGQWHWLLRRAVELPRPIEHRGDYGVRRLPVPVSRRVRRAMRTRTS